MKIPVTARLSDDGNEALVRQIIAEVVGAEAVSLNQSLVWDLLADSLQLVELYTTLEGTFGIRIADAEVGKEMTVSDVCELVKSKL